MQHLEGQFTLSACWQQVDRQQENYMSLLGQQSHPVVFKDGSELRRHVCALNFAKGVPKLWAVGKGSSVSLQALAEFAVHN